MNPPFTLEQFRQVFVEYNNGVFPIQVALYIAGVAAVVFVFLPIPRAGAAISSILAFLWLWMGLVYHLMYFTTINQAAYIFGMVFSFQGLLFLMYGMMQNRLDFVWRKDRNSITGFCLILFAMLIYPLLSILGGLKYPGTPTFGLPCPTTIFTFGMLLLSRYKCPPFLLVIPFAWAIIGTTAVFYFRVWADAGLILSALIAIPLILSHNKRVNSHPFVKEEDQM